MHAAMPPNVSKKKVKPAWITIPSPVSIRHAGQQPAHLVWGNPALIRESAQREIRETSIVWKRSARESQAAKTRPLRTTCASVAFIANAPDFTVTPAQGRVSVNVTMIHRVAEKSAIILTQICNLPRAGHSTHLVLDNAAPIKASAHWIIHFARKEGAGDTQVAKTLPLVTTSARVALTMNASDFFAARLQVRVSVNATMASRVKKVKSV